MAKRDPQRTQKLRIAIRYLLERDCMAKGNQSRLAEHFKVTRQRVHQIVVEERREVIRGASGEGPSFMDSTAADPAQPSWRAS